MKGRFSRTQMASFLDRGYEVETSYVRAKGLNPASAPWFVLFRAYVKIAYANWHFTWLRTKFSDPSAIRMVGWIEKFARAPFSFFQQNDDKRVYVRDDFLTKPDVINKQAVADMSAFLHAQEYYFDIYRGEYVQSGLHADGAPATIYARTVDFVRSDAFWRIITSPAIVDTCRNVMGRNARITWAWLWYSNPSTDETYQNQNWHRDTGEPFNFVRLFVPLTDVRDAADGPTVVVKGSTKKQVLCERRRFTEDEVVEALGTDDTVMALADRGDLYCANTFCVHRGLPPKRPREMLSLLVSFQSSYRTKGLPLVPLSSLGKTEAACVVANRNFYSEICDFNS